MGAGGTKPPEARRTSLLNSRYWQALTNSFLPDVLVCSITEYLYEFRRILTSQGKSKYKRVKMLSDTTHPNVL